MDVLAFLLLQLMNLQARQLIHAPIQLIRKITRRPPV
jgi:hypothetical protein